MATEAQKRAKERYRRKAVKQICVMFYPSEAELWEHLQLKENKQGYIKSLIRKDKQK